MRLRTLHLARLMLLLSALGAAQSATRPAGEVTFRGKYIAAVLFQKCVDACSEQTRQLHESHSNAASVTGISGASLAAIDTAWTMRPPAAQTASLHAVTGLVRA
jgi:hypothetical protein